MKTCHIWHLINTIGLQSRGLHKLSLNKKERLPCRMPLFNHSVALFYSLRILMTHINVVLMGIMPV